MMRSLWLSAMAAAMLAGCSGGSGPNTIVLSNCTKDTGVVRAGPLDNTGLDGSGDNDAAGPGGGDNAGADGQFRNTLVIVRNRHLEEIGRTRTDSERGMVTIILGNCRDPIEIEYRGGDGATYFDEATGRSEPFPEGKRLRARYTTLPRHSGVTAYTEAAVRLMELAPGGPPTTINALDVEAANRRIAEILTDQLPGALRPLKDGVPTLLDITRLPVPLNESNFKSPGTLRDNPGGQYGAVIAGLARAGGTLVSSGAEGSPGVAQTPALAVSDQLAEDLSDGKLDLQGPNGPIAAGNLRPAYTFETLWRSKTIAAGLTAGDAGDAALRIATERAKIAEFVSSTERNYQTAIGAYPGRSVGSQTVRLYGNGRLTVQSGMAAAFGPDATYYSVQNPESDVDLRDPSTGQPLRFVDAKIGSGGDILALRQDRRAFVHIDSIDRSLYIVRGSEDPGNRAVNEALMRPSLAFTPRQLAPGVLGASIVSFTPSPQDREVGPGQPKPDFLFVLADGTLRGGFSDGFRPSIPLPQPEPLLGIVYDKFVPPAHDPRYGPAPAQPVQLPWSGPRRLYGLTRLGKVVTWIEGEAAQGVALAIPGTVVLLASESKTSVYALTSDGKVYWINADQSHLQGVGTTFPTQPSLAAYPRRFPLHHIEPVGGLDQPICWVARTDAVACNTGDVYRWDERQLRARLTFGGVGSLDATYVPVAAAVNARKVEGLPPIWRLTAVEELYKQTQSGQTIFTEGVRYIPVVMPADGLLLSPEEYLGQRNLVSTFKKGSEFATGSGLVPGGDYQWLDGSQLRKAFDSLLDPQRFPPPNGIVRASTAPSDASRTFGFRLTRTGDGLYNVRLSVDGDRDPLHPAIEMTLGYSPNPSAVGIPRMTSLRVGDPAIASFSLLDQEARNFPDPRPDGNPAIFRTNQTLRAWDNYYANPVNGGAFAPDPAAGLRRVKLFVQPVLSRPFEFRLCFSFEGQALPSLSVRIGRLACSIHDNFGTFTGEVSALSFHTPYSGGVRAGPTTRLDFGHLIEGE